MTKRSNQAGFTIVELLIATAVFSVILIVITVALLQVGRAYYKGVTTARTQEVARSILDEVSKAIQFQGGVVTAAQNNSYCVAGTLYSYTLDKQLTDDSPNGDQSRHVLVATTLGNNVCNSSTPAEDLTVPDLPANSRELMAVDMRLTRFIIDDSLGNNLYRIEVQVIAGDGDLLNATRDGCASLSIGSQFCAVSTLATTIQKRVL